MEFQEALTEAIGIWGRLIAGSFKRNGGSTRIYNYEDYKTVEQLNSLLEIDRTGVSTCFALWGLSHRRLRSWSFTFEEVIEKAHESSKEFADSLALYRLLRHPALQEVLVENSESVRRALTHYQAKEDAFEMAEDFEALADIREAAVRATSDLQVFQFAWGEATGDPNKYNPSIYRFLDVNGAVNAIQLSGQIGVTLAIISDNEAEEQEDLNAFFALFIYDGGTLTMLTDKTEWVHPKQAGMLRNARHVARKHDKSYFPYDLLDIVFLDKDRQASVKDRSGLINFDFKMSKVKDINEIQPSCMIFIAMLLELASREYIEGKRRTESLAYTVSSVHRSVLLGEVESPGTLINVDKKEALPELSSSDVTHKSIEWDQEGNHGFFQWAEDRYSPSMPAAWLNLYEDAELRQRLIGENTKNEDLILGMAAAKPDTFGTMAELKNYQKWTARYNQACFVAHELEREIKEKAASIERWIRARIECNFSNLEQAIAQLRAECRKEPLDGFAGHGCKKTSYNLVHVHCGNKNHSSYWYRGSRIYVRFAQGDGCYYSGKVSTIFANFSPINAEGFAFLCGCGVDTLPPLLQHYCEEEPYTGNHLLSNIDPMDWVPDCRVFKALSTTVQVRMTKTAFNDLRKLYGLPKFTDWAAITKKD